MQPSQQDLITRARCGFHNASHKLMKEQALRKFWARFTQASSKLKQSQNYQFAPFKNQVALRLIHTSIQNLSKTCSRKRVQAYFERSCASSRCVGAGMAQGVCASRNNFHSALMEVFNAAHLMERLCLAVSICSK